MNEGPDPHDGKSAGQPAVWVLLAVAIYLGPFLAVTVDELVLKTYWFHKHMPSWFGDMLRTLYAPLIHVVKALWR